MLTTTLIISIYDRAEDLRATLQGCLVDYPCGATNVVLASDGAKQEVIDVALEYMVKFSNVRLMEMQHQGIAGAISSSIERVVEQEILGGGPFASLADRDSFGVIIRMDSDCVIKKEGWARQMAQVLEQNPEIGILAPDWPGRYMRLKRNNYEEVEYCLGIVMAFRWQVAATVSRYLGNGFFDRALHHQFEPDVCLRARMLGYRIALANVGEMVHLGEGRGDSSIQTRESNVCIGGYEFLQKWNERFVGPNFQYKSPMMLRWDEFPPNYLWRRMWLSQFPVNENPSTVVLQNHTFEQILFPVTPGKWLLHETRQARAEDLFFSATIPYEDTATPLLLGQRGWTPEDSQW